MNSLQTKGHDSIWVIVDRLTKCTYFLPINQKLLMDKLKELYIREIVKLHGVPTSNIQKWRQRNTRRNLGIGRQHEKVIPIYVSS